MAMIASHNTKNLAAMHRRGQRLVIFTTICSTFLILFCGVSAAQLIRQYRAAHSETASEGSDQKTALEAGKSPQESAQNETTAPGSGGDSSSTSPSSSGSTTPSSPNSTPSDSAKPSSGSGPGSGSGSSTPPANPPAAPSPIWQEEFSSSLDLTTSAHTGRWRPNDFWQNINKGYRDFAGSNWNLNPNEHPSYNPFSVSGGNLRITSRRTPAELNSSIASSMASQQQTGSVPEWSGGMLITNKDVRTFSNGYYEFRARFPNPGQGMFPAIWLYSANAALNPGKENAEIDILEIFGHSGGGTVNTGLVFMGSNNVKQRESYNGSVNGDTTGWHTYGFDWQSNYMRFYKDNVLYMQAGQSEAGWFNGVKMGIRLNYAMDAPWFGSNRRSNGSTPSQLYMDVDYVRYYSTKP